ncbi:MAG TPA: VTT domain-containing protein [Methylomirabilota bacterium]|jgi:membrane protein DedA with SNARE-associated domain
MNAIIEVLVRYGYAVVFGSVLAEQIGLPIPAIPVLLAAGGLAGAGRLSLPLLLVGAGIASLIADTAWYWIGRTGGARVLGWLCRISLERDSCVRRTERAFGAYGAYSLLFAKFVPGYSTVAPPLAGIVKMSVLQFTVLSGLAGLFWSGAFVALGWIFSSQLELVAEYASHLGAWALVLAGAGLAGYITFKYISRQRFLRQIRIARIKPEELKSMLDAGQDVMVVDVRDRLDFETEPSIIPGALHLSIDELEARHSEIPREREIVLYCT